MEFLLLAILTTCFVGNIASPRNDKLEIIGEINAEGGGFPCLVSVQSCESEQQCKHVCGGTIVSPRAVVTAAHCIPGEAQNGSISLKIVAGLKNLNELNTGSQERYVDSYSVHPKFNKKNGSLKNDIAVLHLSTELNFTSLAQPAKLPKQGYYPRGFGIVAGWERENTSPIRVLSNLLKTLAVSIIPDIHVCVKKLPPDCKGAIDLHGGSFCAFLRKGTSSCDGYDGGPLRDSKNVFVGILSSTPEPCGTYPNVYVNVGHYVTYLKSEIPDLA